MKNFNVNTDQLIVKFTCPICGDTIEKDVTESIPVPDWSAEHATDSENSDSTDVVCESCGKEFTIEIFKNIYEGNVQVSYYDTYNIWHEIDDVELEEYESSENNED